MAISFEHKGYLLGYDIGSSSIKAALVDADTQATIAVVQEPKEAMPINAPKPGWAEQDPEMWWKNLCIATHELLLQTAIDPHDIKAIGIAYQMHGLVCVDDAQKVLRPAIIWCDGRAVHIGNVAFDIIGQERCLSHLLNAPGNFTASKLGWVKENEPEIFSRITKFMLPGDYIAMKLTGEIVTTPAGLSEGMFWDFTKEDLADFVFDHFGIDIEMTPTVVPVFSTQGMVHEKAARETGLVEGIPVTYRSGDQPNNAMSLGVLNPREIAASGGTSGVVYGVTHSLLYDPILRVNSFVHVNHLKTDPRIGILLCINGAGSQYNWIKEHVAPVEMSYRQMEEAASQVPIGSDGLRVFPFGNGVERMFLNQEVGSHLMHLDVNRHTRTHVYRAALEGIAFAFVYGIRILQRLGLTISKIRVGNDNLFQSSIFSSTISTLSGAEIEIIDTTGAVGAAKAAGVAIGTFTSIEEAFTDLKLLHSYAPDANDDPYLNAYASWELDLERLLK